MKKPPNPSLSTLRSQPLVIYAARFLLPKQFPLTFNSPYCCSGLDPCGAHTWASISHLIKSSLSYLRIVACRFTVRCSLCRFDAVFSLSLAKPFLQTLWSSSCSNRTYLDSDSLENSGSSAMDRFMVGTWGIAAVNSPLAQLLSLRWLGCRTISSCLPEVYLTSPVPSLTHYAIRCHGEPGFVLLFTFSSVLIDSVDGPLTLYDSSAKAWHLCFSVVRYITHPPSYSCRHLVRWCRVPLGFALPCSPGLPCYSPISPCLMFLYDCLHPSPSCFYFISTSIVGLCLLILVMLTVLLVMVDWWALSRACILACIFTCWFIMEFLFMGWKWPRARLSRKKKGQQRVALAKHIEMIFELRLLY